MLYAILEFRSVSVSDKRNEVGICLYNYYQRVAATGMLVRENIRPVVSALAVTMSSNILLIFATNFHNQFLNFI